VKEQPNEPRLPQKNSIYLLQSLIVTSLSITQD
jgi:hypothetical protein